MANQKNRVWSTSPGLCFSPDAASYAGNLCLGELEDWIIDKEPRVQVKAIPNKDGTYDIKSVASIDGNKSRRRPRFTNWISTDLPEHAALQFLYMCEKSSITTRLFKRQCPDIVCYPDDLFNAVAKTLPPRDVPKGETPDSIMRRYPLPYVLESKKYFMLSAYDDDSFIVDKDELDDDEDTRPRGSAITNEGFMFSTFFNSELEDDEDEEDCEEDESDDEYEDDDYEQEQETEYERIIAQYKETAFRGLSEEDQMRLEKGLVEMEAPSQIILVYEPRCHTLEDFAPQEGGWPAPPRCKSFKDGRKAMLCALKSIPEPVLRLYNIGRQSIEPLFETDSWQVALQVQENLEDATLERRIHLDERYRLIANMDSMDYGRYKPYAAAMDKNWLDFKTTHRLD